MTNYLDVADVLEIAGITLGSPPRVRDYGLLESAVARPRAGIFGTDAYPGLYDKAAALLHSLAGNHALIDGNKRTAWAAALVFLEINGHPLAVPLDEDAAEEMVCAAAQNQLLLEDIARSLATFTASGN